MSDLKAILDATKRIESILEQQCGGHGRGMHEKLSHVQLPLPEPLVRRVRYIASVRNKVVHESGYDIEDMPAFLQTCTRAADELEALAATTPLAEQPVPANAAHGARAQQRRWWMLLVLLGLLVWWGWQAFHSARSVPRLQRPDGATRSATAPSPAPTGAPRAAMAAGAAPAASAPPPATAPAAATAAATAVAPVRMADLGLHYGHDAFHMPEAHIRITLTNTAQGTLSQLWLHARLYVNGEHTPVLDTANQRHARPLFVHLGERGLRAGETRTFTVTADRMGHSNWLAPDVLNARTRRLEVVVDRYTDGRNQQHPASGPTLSTSAQPLVQASAPSPVMPHPPAAPAEHGLLQISQPSIRYVKGSFDRTEPRIEVTLHNQTGQTVAHVFLAGRLYLDGASSPALTTYSDPRRTDHFFVHLGENGLRAGERRTVTLYANGLGHSAWKAPDALNAHKRRLELAVMHYTNGRGQRLAVSDDPHTAHWQ